MYEYQLIQGGEVVTSVMAPTDAEARYEIGHYALVYGQDGPVQIKRLDENEIECGGCKSPMRDCACGDW